LTGIAPEASVNRVTLRCNSARLTATYLSVRLIRLTSRASI
jgi:hypothetical protein